jgi:tripartite-type tricarboxylate transporter receptor subunit TctC
MAGAASAQPSWPVKALSLLTPFQPGPGPDLYLRPLFTKVGEQLGQVVVHDVRTGGGGTLVLQQLMRANPDGHAMAVVTNSNLIQRQLTPAITPDIVDFAHISRLSLSGATLVVSAGSPVRSLQDLVAQAKATPAKLNYGSGGTGTPSHLQGATLLALTGMEAVHVPFKNSADVIPSVLRGDLQFSFQVMSFGAPFVKSGKLRLLATTGRERAREFPDSPTLYELIKDELAVQENWLGVSFPTNTPVPVVQRMHAEILKAIADPQVLKGMQSSGTNVSPNPTPEDFAAYVKRESDKWGRIVKLSGAKVE